MAIIDKTYFIEDAEILSVDADPLTTPVDAIAGSIIFYRAVENTPAVLFVKLANGNNVASAKLTTRDNFNATSNPLSTNDITQGFDSGSNWYNTTDETFYVCLSSTFQNAEWAKLVTDNKLDPAQFDIDTDGTIRFKINLDAATKTAVADQAARLALPTIDNLYIVTQTDEERIYYLPADLDPSDNANWQQGPSTGDSVLSFRGALKPDLSGPADASDARTGEVIASIGDYIQRQVITIHDDTGVRGWLGIDNQGIYWDDGA